jgi:hypothetical protein
LFALRSLPTISLATPQDASNGKRSRLSREPQLAAMVRSIHETLPIAFPISYIGYCLVSNLSHVALLWHWYLIYSLILAIANLLKFPTTIYFWYLLTASQ